MFTYGGWLSTRGAQTAAAAAGGALTTFGPTPPYCCAVWIGGAVAGLVVQVAHWRHWTRPIFEVVDPRRFHKQKSVAPVPVAVDLWPVVAAILVAVVGSVAAAAAAVAAAVSAAAVAAANLAQFGPVTRATMAPTLRCPWFVADAAGARLPQSSVPPPDWCSGCRCCGACKQIVCSIDWPANHHPHTGRDSFQHIHTTYFVSGCANVCETTPKQTSGKWSRTSQFGYIFKDLLVPETFHSKLSVRTNSG